MVAPEHTRCCERNNDEVFLREIHSELDPRGIPSLGQHFQIFPRVLKNMVFFGNISKFNLKAFCHTRALQQKREVKQV